MIVVENDCTMAECLFCWKPQLFNVKLQYVQIKGLKLVASNILFLGNL